MHELGLCESILYAVEERAGGRPVAAIAVTVGGAHVADATALRTAFAMAAQGTVAQDAQLDINVDPPRLRCGGCGAETLQETWSPPACAQCGGVDVELVRGDELVLDEITLASG
jgi:hydrogenase nickel incorporation protein HypA/HybF